MLAQRWSLVMPNRPGFGESPPLARGDFELEAPLVQVSKYDLPEPDLI
jgi:hypothetical protein